MVEKIAPELEGIEAWINSKPLKLENLRGKVVMLDFWTYSCINCIRTIPHLRELHDKYSKKGLVIIGVHAPEFAFERELKNVKEAVKKHNIKYPVALDNSHMTWDLYGNRFWPRTTLIDSKGLIAMEHIGEGGYDEIEDKIIELLTEIGFSSKRKFLKPYEMDYNPNTTKETYCGFSKNPLSISPVSEDMYVDNLKKHEPGIIYLQGPWKQHSEFLNLTKDSEGYILLKYSAKSVNAVLKPMKGKSFKAEVLIDNKPVKKEIAGSDIKFKDNKSFVFVNHPDMYNLVNSQKFETHELKIVVDSSEFSIYAFTFG